jgi:hypothetical protein
MKNQVWKLERRLINSNEKIVSYHINYKDMGEYINVNFATLKQIYYLLRSNILEIDNNLYKIVITKEYSKNLSPEIYFSLFNIKKETEEEKECELCKKHNRLLNKKRKYIESINSTTLI